MANEFSELKERIDKNLKDETKPWANILKLIEETTGVDRQYIFWGFVAATLLWLAFGFAGQLICNFVGTLYPAYASIHAIESHDKNDDTKWLTYWIVFSGFSFLEHFAAYIVGWFPLYWLVKCLLFVWLMIPTNLNGSLILYRNIIRPYFLKYHGIVDDTISQAQSTATEFLEKNK